MNVFQILSEKLARRLGRLHASIVFSVLFLVVLAAALVWALDTRIISGYIRSVASGAMPLDDAAVYVWLWSMGLVTSLAVITYVTLYLGVVRPVRAYRDKKNAELAAAPDKKDVEMLSSVCNRRTQQLDAALTDNSELRERLTARTRDAKIRKLSLEALISASTELFLVASINNKVISVSSPMARILGLRPQELIAQPLDDVLFLYDAAKERPREYRLLGLVDDVLQRASSMPNMQEMLLLDRKSHEHSVLLSSSAILDESGDAIAALFRAEPYGSESSKSIQASTHTLLSGNHSGEMASRDAFNRRFDELLLIARNQRTEHALLLVSLDNLQQVYDEFGHEAGDELLWQSARALDDELGTKGDVYRMTALHFGVFLPFTGEAKATALAEELRRAIEAHEFQWHDTVFATSVSISIVPVSHTSDNRSESLARASELLSAAKKAGGNRVMAMVSDELDEFTQQVDQKLANWLGPNLEESRLHLMSREVLLTSSRTGGMPMVETHLKVELDDGFWIDPLPFLRSAHRRGMAQRIDLWTIEHVLNAVNKRPGFANEFEYVLVPVTGESLLQPGFDNDLKGITAEHASAAERLVLLIEESFSRTHAAPTERFLRSLREQNLRWGFHKCRSSSFNDHVSNLKPTIAMLHEQISNDIVGNPVATARLQYLSKLSQHYGFKLVGADVRDDATMDALAEFGILYASKEGFDGVGPIVV